jgi:hypothetical protein
MDEKLEKIIKERFEALPESIQGIILSSNYEGTLLKISKKYNLRVEQMAALELVTTMVMMGITNPDNFQRELTKELGMDAEKGRLITKDINEEIFARIRDLLKLMNTPPGEEPRVEEERGGQRTSPENTAPRREEKTAPISTPSLHADKLMGYSKTPSTKTEYTIPGVSGAGEAENPVPKKPVVDPYREPPE